MSQNRHPINPEFRFLLENYFGEDFSKVTIHRGFLARRLTRRLKARAVTLGSRIFVAPGEEIEHYPLGLWLIAHEAVHVLQYRRQGFLKFLVRYGGDFLRGILGGRRVLEAYRNVGAEAEAFAIEADFRERIGRNPEIAGILRRDELGPEEKLRLLREKGRFLTAVFRPGGSGAPGPIF